MAALRLRGPGCPSVVLMLYCQSMPWKHSSGPPLHPSSPAIGALHPFSPLAATVLTCHASPCPCLILGSTDNCARTVRKEERLADIVTAVGRGCELLLELETVGGE